MINSKHFRNLRFFQPVEDKNLNIFYIYDPYLDNIVNLSNTSYEYQPDESLEGKIFHVGVCTISDISI